MGTWIEMGIDPMWRGSVVVVPYVGTWIEILSTCHHSVSVLSVVPYVGTWIEIQSE